MCDVGGGGDGGVVHTKLFKCWQPCRDGINIELTIFGGNSSIFAYICRCACAHIHTHTHTHTNLHHTPMSNRSRPRQFHLF